MRYDNYVRAVASSLFNDEQQYAKRYTKQIPKYPEVYDYYRIDRVLDVGVGVQDLKIWNQSLSDVMREIGVKKHANVIIVFVNNPDPKYAYGLRSAWKGYKKNDAVITVGVTEYPKIAWVDVHSWSKNDLFNVTMRDELLAQKELDLAEFMETVKSISLSHFERRPMKDFEYLKDEIEPPLWSMIIAMIIAFIGSPLLTWFFHRNDVDIRFSFERRKRW